MFSVMVTKSTCAGPYIPTVIIKSINVPLHGDWAALLQLLKQFICRLLTRHWHLSTACQRNGIAVSGKSPRGPTFLSVFFSVPLSLWAKLRRQLRAQCWQEISCQLRLFFFSRMTSDVISLHSHNFMIHFHLRMSDTSAIIKQFK